MTTISVELPDSVFHALRESPEQVARDIRVAAAVDWFARGLVSQGRAAELAGIPRVAFLDELARRRVPAINISMDELRRELQDISGEK